MPSTLKRFIGLRPLSHRLLVSGLNVYSATKPSKCLRSVGRIVSPELGDTVQFVWDFDWKSDGIPWTQALVTCTVWGRDLCLSPARPRLLLSWQVEQRASPYRAVECLFDCGPEERHLLHHDAFEYFFD